MPLCNYALKFDARRQVKITRQWKSTLSVALDSCDQLGFRVRAAPCPPFLAILGDPGADSECNGKSKRAEKNVAKKSRERHFFRPFRLSLALTFVPASPRKIFSLQNRRYFFAFYRRSKQARNARHGRWGKTPSPSPVSSALHYRFVLRSTYSAGGLRFLSHVTWKIVGKLRRYFTSFPGCQSSAPKMPRQRRETVAERRGLSKCLKEHQHNGWFT